MAMSVLVAVFCHRRYLGLASNSLQSSLPSSISTLSALQYLDVSGNFLSFTLPTTLQYLTSLQYLDVSMQFDMDTPANVAGFVGGLPAELASLTALE